MLADFDCGAALAGFGAAVLLFDGAGFFALLFAALVFAGFAVLAFAAAFGFAWRAAGLRAAFFFAVFGFFAAFAFPALRAGFLVLVFFFVFFAMMLRSIVSMNIDDGRDFSAKTRFVLSPRR